MGQVIITKEAADILGVDEFSRLSIVAERVFGSYEYKIGIIDAKAGPNPHSTRNEDGSWTFEISEDMHELMRSTCPLAEPEDAVVMPMLRRPDDLGFRALVNPHVNPSNP